MRAKRDSVNRFVRQSIAVVQIQRHGRWWNTLWVWEDGKPTCSTAILSEELGVVTGVRLKYLPNAEALRPAPAGTHQPLVGSLNGGDK